MPAGGPPFIDRSVFNELIARVPTVAGKSYQDLDTIYRDMSRLVVAWLGNLTPSEIRKLYNNLGWEGEANARALHECAKSWLAEYHPELLRDTRG